MARFVPTLVKLLAVVLMLTAIGCEDKTADIDRLNQDLADRDQQLLDLQDQLHQCRAGQAGVVGDAAAMQAERDRLNAELAALRAELSDAEGWQTVPGGVLINIEGQVLFDSGESELRVEGKETLDAIIAKLATEYGDHDVYVFGHTDDVPIKESGWKDNYELSCQRGLSVVRYLRSQGLGMYVAACGWGEHRPIADNSSAEGRQTNRRVQIFAYKPQ